MTPASGPAVPRAPSSTPARYLFVSDVHLDAAARHLAQRGQYRRAFTCIVIPDPTLEQIAQDVERASCRWICDLRAQ
ncbi:MAG: hypothetical protein ACREVO_18890, partial [Steroidobacteraceae bacterium]